MTIEKSKMRYGIGWLCALLLLLTSCKDEDWYGNGHCPEGEPATISLKISIPDMDVRTRAAMSDADASKVNDLWVGIYNVTTGKCTYNGYFPNLTNDRHHVLNKLEGINTKSGKSRIVAVANVTGINNEGYCSLALTPESGETIAEGTRKELKVLLKAADTWEKFTAISAAHVNPENVSSFDANLVMAGVYQTYGDDTDDKWDNDQTVDIQVGNNTLSGALHLRRLLSYIKFNIFAADDEQNKVYGLNVDLKSWRVCNNPALSFLHEQEGNAGDKAVFLKTGTGNDPAVESNYASSNISYDFEKGTVNEKECRMFDFYQYENKHQGVSTLTGYHEREKEHQNSDTKNTGIYSSLCSSADKTADDYWNNFATFVEFSAEVSYYLDENRSKLRTGNVIYRIHLGYCEGGGEETKAKDFNCRRNTQYTYNVTIKGLDKVVVEAKKGSTPYQNGVEGEVYDATAKVIDLDAHYGVFNIQLSNKERANLQYIIRAPYDNEVKEIRREKKDDDFIMSENKDDEKQFYEWIRFRPTDNETTLALYKNSEEEEAPWTLDQLTAISNGKLTNKHMDDKDGDVNDEVERWYTVFIDENVYHKDGQEAGNESGEKWWKYVNKDPRTIYLSVQHSNVSEDQDSRYGSAKYMIRQKSIQTYYATTGNNISSTAIGVEHINETSGLNLRWTDDVVGKDKWNADNGRWNMWQHVNGGWNDFVDADKMMSIPEVSNQNMGKGISRAATIQPVMALKAITGQDYMHKVSTDEEKNPVTHDPNNTDNYYEAMNLCLSRNRDLNGNGKIDANELRWYLPAMGKYVRIVLGRHSLETPLIDPATFNPAHFTAGEENSCFHYISSDRLVLWAEEGMSVERKGLNGGKYRSAWEVRCIRNLGVDMTRVVENDPVTVAYTHDETTRTFTMTYYDASSIRTQPMTNIPVHEIVNPLNMPYKKFQYAEKDCTLPTADNENGVYLTKKEGNGYVLNFDGKLENWEPIIADVWSSSVQANSICGLYSEEADGSDKGQWRVPNQKELTMMRREKDKVFDLPELRYMWQWISCSKEFLGDGKRMSGIFYNNNRSNSGVYWGNTGNTEYYILSGNSDTFTHVRCVRDVIE